MDIDKLKSFKDKKPYPHNREDFEEDPFNTTDVNGWGLITSWKEDIISKVTKGEDDFILGDILIKDISIRLGHEYHTISFYTEKESTVRLLVREIWITLKDEGWTPVKHKAYQYKRKINTEADKKIVDIPKSHEYTLKPINKRCGSSDFSIETLQGFIDGRLLVDGSIKPFNIKENPIFNNKGESEMARRKVVVNLWDDSKDLDAVDSLVGNYLMITEDNDNTTIQQVLMEEDVKGDIEKHNKMRKLKVDKQILRNTGRKVDLEPISLKDLRWEVTTG